MTTLRGIAQPSDYRLSHTLLAYWRSLLGAMPSFVLLAVLGSAIAVSVVLVMYMLVRRWL